MPLNLRMSISLSIYIDFNLFLVEFGIDDVLNLFFEELHLHLKIMRD